MNCRRFSLQSALLACSALATSSVIAQQPGSAAPQQSPGAVTSPTIALSAPQASAVVGPLAPLALGERLGAAWSSNQGPPAAPFQLTPIEQQFVFQTLQMWEQQSSQVNTF